VPKYVNVMPVCPAAPEVTGIARMSPGVTTLMVVVTELVPSEIVIVYWPIDVGKSAAVSGAEITAAIWPLASVFSLLLVEICAADDQVTLDGVIHSDGMPGEPEIVSSVLALKPDRMYFMFATVLCGTEVVVESTYVGGTTTAPVVIVAFGVTVNVADPTFPSASATATFCAPAAPALSATAPAGIWNRNTDVPCSVVAGATGKTDAVALAVATPLPTLTVLIAVNGPKPDTVAVTHVPTGPELGDSDTVGAVVDSEVVALLPQESVRVNDGPAAVSAPRLTVPVYVPT
jgi:hypothetical protein